MSETLGSTSQLQLIIPSALDTDWATSIRDNCFQKIVEHDHTGTSGKGLKLSTSALDNDSITEALIELSNNAYLVSANAAGSGDINLIKANASDYIEFGAQIAALNINNNVNITGRNSADSANINIIKVNASDEIELGAVATLITGSTIPSPVINVGVSGTAILDEDNLASDSATQLATQQSIKAYVDATVSTGTANEIEITGTAIGLADNPVIPGTGATSFATTDALLIPAGTTAQQVSTTDGALRYNSDTSSFEGYSSAAWSAIGGAAGGGDSEQIKLYKANTDGTTDWTVKSIDDILPDFDGTDTLTATFSVPSSGSNALLSVDDDHAVYQLASAASSQYDGIGVDINIPRYVRGEDVMLKFEYRTNDDSGASADSDYMVWVYDQTNGVNTTTTSTGSQVAGSSLVVGTSTGMSVGDKIWVGETGGTAQVTEAYITAIADSTHVTISEDVNLTSGDRIITGILTDVLTTLNAADDDTNKAGNTFKVSFLTESTTAQVTVMFQQLTSQTDSDLFFDKVELTSEINAHLTTKLDNESYICSDWTGYGSSNTAVAKFGTETLNTTGKLVSVDTDGLTFTALKPCKITMTHRNEATASMYIGITKNATLSTSLQSVPEANVVANGEASAGAPASVTFSGILAVGDVIAAHTRTGYTVTADPLHQGVTALFEPIEESTAIVVDNIDPHYTEHGFWHTTGGYGSTNTKIPYYNTETANTFSKLLLIDYNDSTNGFSATALVDCWVTLNHTFNSSAQGNGWSLNSSQLTTNVDSITVAERIAYVGLPASLGNTATCVYKLNAGDIIRPHTNGTAASTAASCNITILARTTSTKVPNLVQLPTVSYGQNPEQVRYTGHAGYGSTATKIPYWSTEQSNTLNNLATITNDSTNGTVFTAIQRCLVTAKMSAGFSTSIENGWSLNSSQLTTGLSSINAADRLSLQANVSGNLVTSVVRRILEPGDILRPHQSPGTASNTSLWEMEIVAEPIVSGNTNQAAIIAQPVAYVKDIKASTTVGGTATTSAWTKRDLTTLQGDIGAVGVTLSSSTMTVPAGKYKFNVKAPFYSSASTRIRLRNTTDSTDVCNGQCYVAGTTEAAGFAHAQGVVTFTKSTNLEVQYYTATSGSTSDLGNAISIAGYSEVYTQVEITRMK